jgi:plasmid stability protein
MATLTIRNLPDNVHQGLRARAAANGRSMEAEARAVLSLNIESTPVSSEVAAEANRKKWAKINEDARRILMRANNGVMPTNVVDEWLAEKRIIAAREQADYDRMAGLEPKS